MRLIQINKEEKEALLKAVPDAVIARTMKTKSKRAHYFCEESSAVVNFIQEFRKQAKQESECYAGGAENGIVTHDGRV